MQTNSSPKLYIYSMCPALQWSKTYSIHASKSESSSMMYIHSGRLTWNLRRDPWKRKIIFQTIIFRFYVNLQGSTCFWLYRSLHGIVQGNNRVTGCSWVPSNRQLNHMYLSLRFLPVFNQDGSRPHCSPIDALAAAVFLLIGLLNSYFDIQESRRTN